MFDMQPFSRIDEVLAMYTGTDISDIVGLIVAKFVNPGGDALIYMLLGGMTFDPCNGDGMCPLADGSSVEVLP